MSETHILEKVKKLLSMTEENGCTEAEAESSFEAAQRLLAKHNLDLSQVDGEPAPRKMVMKRATHKWNAAWRSLLADAVAKNFCCKYFYQGNLITFFGYEDDVLVSVEVFNAAYKFIYKNATRVYNEAYKTGKPRKGLMHSYALGFIHGLRAAWDAQSVALMVVVPPEVTQKYENMAADWSNITTAIRTSAHGAEAYQQGKKDGTDYMSRKKVTY